MTFSLQENREVCSETLLLLHCSVSLRDIGHYNAVHREYASQGNLKI